MAKELSKHDLTYKLVAWVDLFKYECSHSEDVKWTKEDEQAYQQICKAIDCMASFEYKGGQFKVTWNKPKVSKEFVEKWIHNLKVGEQVLEWRFEITFSEICKMLKDAGVEVEAT